ncbi:transmembrane protein 87B [Cocos nucifera]|uniref:Transmembrane protein 87B n=1 Tax=Cocos nucifera TaxID=13894 RepID=A0A8K0IHU2_COCNU|nr:transmembrane protein 87B [Cocos nucifera]
MVRLDLPALPSSPFRLVIFGLLPALFFYFGDASVHDYTGEKFAAKGNAFVLHGGSEGLYASLPSPNSTAAGNGDSFIRSGDFIEAWSLECGGLGADSVKVQAIIFEIDDRESIGGSAYGGQRAICCTPDLAKLGVCTQGAIIYRPSTQNPEWPQVFVASFNGKDPVATLQSHTVTIPRTGMYNLYFMYCDPALDGLIIEGKTVWKNPTGYLPGRMAPLRNFYGFMSLAFVILGIFWFSQYARFWREILPLQNCITLVIALGMFEMALWYFEYAEFNETGVRPKGITFWAVTFGAVKRTVSRIIILVVSMGFGVVRPTLGGLTSKVVMLGATFLLASEVLELVENVGAVSDLSGKARLFLVLPVAVLDAFFILWIFTSLSKTLDKLQARRLMAKLDIYRKFTNALAVAVILSVGWIGYEMVILPFELKSCVAFSAMMRYAYSGDSEDFEREDTLSLIKPGPIPSKDGWGCSASPDAKAALSINTTTSHNGDTEEDKRE